MLDSGGYGPVTITKPLIIEAPPGVTAFVHPPSGDAISINAGSSDTVILRGLVLSSGFGFGVKVTSVGVLHVENCVVSGFSNDAIHVEAPNSFVFLKDTICRGNLNGFVMRTGRGVADHCRFEGNGAGVAVDGADVTVRDSVAAGNFFGFDAESNGSENTILQVYDSLSTNNEGDGFSASATAGGSVNARVANSSVGENIGMGLHNWAGQRSSRWGTTSSEAMWAVMSRQALC